MTVESAPDGLSAPDPVHADNGLDPLSDLDVDLAHLETDPYAEQSERQASTRTQNRFAELVNEYEADHLGPLWLVEIRRLCIAATRRYPARAYNDTEIWDAAAVEDLTMDAVERLLVKGQISYICAVAHDLDSARKLLWRQIKFTLSTRRRPFRTVIDNLLERAIEQLQASPYERVPGPMTAWRRVGSTAEVPAGHDLGPLVARLRRLSRRPGEGSERASSVWATEVLQLALADVVDTVDVVDRRLLDEIFRDALTALVLGELDASTDGSDAAELSPGPEDEAMVADAVERAISGLDDDERTILRLKLNEQTDDAVASVLGVSRQTVDKRKRAAFEKLRLELGTIQDYLDAQVADAIRARLVRGQA